MEPRHWEEIILLLECCAIALLAAILIGPLYRIEYLNNWGSIDSTFIADARFLKDHWPHPRWLPWWYCGTRFDYIYPPVLPYGTAALAMYLDVSTARAYHLFTAMAYCAGIAGVFALIRLGSGSRVWAWAGAAAVATLSPSFLFLSAYRADSVLHMPQRLNVLIRWGEGPHMSALALLPFALAFSWRAIRDGGRRWLALAALASALVVSINFYATTALALLFPLLAWSLWITHGNRRMWLRAAAIAALAYGLTAFWLTASYLRITTDNLKLVAQPGHAWSRWTLLAVALIFALVSARLARQQPARAYAVFVCGAAVFFTLVVAGNYYFDFRVAGEPKRLVPELDLALILFSVEALRILASAKSRWRPAVAAVAAAAALGAGYRYLAHPWSVYDADPDYQQRVEYRLTDWIARNLPDARVFAAGSVRYWYDAWQDGEQVGGGSDQGLLDGVLSLAQWQVIRDDDPSRDMAWLQAIGADAVVVSQGESQEIFHEYAKPSKFAGAFDVVYDSGHGDTIYRVPRRFPAHARVVEARTMDQLRPIPWDNLNQAAIAAYAAAVEKGPDSPVDMQWEGSDALRIRARLRPGESLLIQETFDPSWRASAAGKPLPIRKDPMGFMRVDAPPGDQELRLACALPLENAIGRGMTAVTGLALLFLLFPRRVLK